MVQAASRIRVVEELPTPRMPTEKGRKLLQATR